MGKSDNIIGEIVRVLEGTGSPMYAVEIKRAIQRSNKSMRCSSTGIGHSIQRCGKAYGVARLHKKGDNNSPLLYGLEKNMTPDYTEKSGLELVREEMARSDSA